MPIPPDLRRQFYSGPAWRETQRRIRERAGNKCEQCRRPNGVRCFVLFETTMVGYTKRRQQLWLGPRGSAWRDAQGKPRRDIRWNQIEGFAALPRTVFTVCTVAHLNHTPGDDRDENLRYLCCACHLIHDREHHHETRATPKDAKRPIVAMGHIHFD